MTWYIWQDRRCIGTVIAATEQEALALAEVKFPSPWWDTREAVRRKR